jgi:hypothetical protein
MKFTFLSSEKHRPKRQAIMVASTSQTFGADVSHELVYMRPSGGWTLFVETVSERFSDRRYRVESIPG